MSVVKVHSPPPPTVIAQESMEYKTIVWEADGYPGSQYGTSFPEVMEIEGVSEDEISGCSYAVYSFFHFFDA